MLAEILKERALPPLRSKEEMMAVLLEEEYGHLPPRPTDLRFTVEENVIPSFCAGKAIANRVTARCAVNGKSFSFPFMAVLPTKEGKYPFFIHINFRPDVPDRYMPTEELIDNGFAVLSFCYKDVTSDDGDFTNGLAGVLYPSGERKSNEAGKIAMWAWAAHRVMDYAETRSDLLDLSRAIVCGHSRLGKTALLTAATDARFAFAYSNDSGCSGAAITREKRGETVKAIMKNFPFWFAENYNKYCEKESEMPFDQHFLIAAIAPRCVCVGSAVEDVWADPESEQLSCVAASAAFEEKGLSGFVCPDRFAQVGECFFDGTIGYHMRSGIHYFGREDWLKLIAFFRAKTEK